jgi:hypothetical protein
MKRKYRYSKNKKCRVCDKHIMNRSTFCNKHNLAHQQGEAHPSYKQIKLSETVKKVFTISKQK